LMEVALAAYEDATDRLILALAGQTCKHHARAADELRKQRATLNALLALAFDATAASAQSGFGSPRTVIAGDAPAEILVDLSDTRHAPTEALRIDPNDETPTTASRATSEELNIFAPSEPASLALDELLAPASVLDQLLSSAPLVPEPVPGPQPTYEGPSSAAPAASGPNAEVTEEEHESFDDIKVLIEGWQRGKNVRAMLATLHEVCPARSTWTPTSLGELLDKHMVKDAYNRSILAIHPDKLTQSTQSARDRGQLLFNALRKAWTAFKRDELES